MMQMDWWNVAFIVVAVATLLVTYYTVILNSKKVDFYVVSESPLIDVKKEYKNDLQIFYQGKEIEEAIVIVLRIRNSGRQPIKSEDFNRPISFEFKKGTNIFDAKIIDVNPENLRIGFSIAENIITLEKALLNPKDSIELSLITSSSKRPLVDARIAGVSRISLQEGTDNIIWTKKRIIEYYTLLICVTGVVIGIIIPAISSIISWF